MVCVYHAPFFESVYAFLCPTFHEKDADHVFPFPIGAWRRGRTFGIGLAVAAALLPAIVDYATGNRPVLPVEFWNTAMRLGVFTVVVHLLFRLRVALEAERDRD